MKINMLANLLFVITILFYIGYLNVTSSPMPGGDRGVGYAFVLLICGAGFILFSGLLTWNLAANQRFDWLPLTGSKRSWLLVAGWLTFSFATVICAASKSEKDIPVFIQLVFKWMQYLLPLLLLVPAIIMANVSREPGTVPGFIKMPMLMGFALSLLIGGGMLLTMLGFNIKHNMELAKSSKDRGDHWQHGQLEWIAEHSPDSPVVNMLSLSGRFNNKEVREAAAAKVRSSHNWEAQLIDLLENGYHHTEVYHFIDGNRVDHPDLFVKPIETSIRRLAKDIRSRIKGANDLSPGHFDHFSIERLFRAMDEQFMLPGNNYRSAVLELRKALDTPRPERFADVKRFHITKHVDKWLKKHP